MQGVIKRDKDSTAVEMSWSIHLIAWLYIESLMMKHFIYLQNQSEHNIFHTTIHVWQCRRAWPLRYQLIIDSKIFKLAQIPKRTVWHVWQCRRAWLFRYQLIVDSKIFLAKIPEKIEAQLIPTNLLPKKENKPPLHQKC